MGAAITRVDAHEGMSVSADVEGHGRIEADVFISADGAQSLTRRRLLPDVASRYAGYVAWRGALDEADAPPELVRFFDDAFTFSESRSGGHILVYLIPGDDAETTRMSVLMKGSRPRC